MLEKITLLNRSLLILIIILGSYLILDFANGVSYRFLSENPEGEPVKGAMHSPSDIKPERSFSYYERIFKTRNPFMSSPKEVKRPEKSLKERASDLILLGIISAPGKFPQAVIKNKRTNKSYECKKGEKIEGLRIKEICEDKVILELGIETLELKL